MEEKKKKERREEQLSWGTRPNMAAVSAKNGAGKHVRNLKDTRQKLRWRGFDYITQQTQLMPASLSLWILEFEW